jgi:hypothetical protein
MYSKEMACCNGKGSREEAWFVLASSCLLTVV